jgi:dienelactone hydrolase
MVHEAFVAEVREIMRERQTRLAALKTRADAEAYVTTVRAKIEKCFGPWPERTPLNAQVTGTVDREAYVIEKVIFESRPQFFVTANLYLPKGLKGKAPGVVGSCGHSANGKAAETYQSFAQGLARQGYVVLIFDPIGQGERLQLPTAADVNKSRVGVGVHEHMTVGNQQFLVGEFFGSWRAWDGMRALDYLLSREEVDPQHVGITGNSGGGTMSTWLCGVERRWTMGAPSCFVTSFLRNLENELPADTEQCPPRVLSEGLDHGDFLIAMAPKPVIMMGQERDYFDVRGLTDTYHDVRKLYELLGAEKNVAMFIGANDHGYHQDAREAMYAHFNKATGRGDGPVKEPALTMETDATLQCTKSGQVALELKSRPVYSFTKDSAERLAERRGKVAGLELLNAAKLIVSPDPDFVLRFAPGASPSPYRILRSLKRDGLPLPNVTTYLVEDEPGRQVPFYRLYATPHFSRPPRDGKPAILYVAHDSSEHELRSEPLVREVAAERPDAAI